MLYDNHKAWRSYAKESKYLWVTNALDGSKDNLVSERVYKTLDATVIEFRKELLKTISPKTLKNLLMLITPPKGVK